ncbi:MAG: hypothetical protein AAGL99_12085 [Pseudomonadota bacterium]
MGIDAQAFSKSLPKQLLGRASGRQALKAIDRVARAWSEANEFGPFYRSEIPSNEVLNCSFSPLINWIRFDLSSDWVAVGFRSSNTGPGYHAAVIELLDHLESELKLSWDWGGAGEMCSDETGYAVSRNFGDLQYEMVRFFELLMGHAVEHNQSNGSFCIPFGLGLDRNALACPLGPRPTDWPSQVAEMDGRELASEAASFFPWWNRERDRKFWESMLLGTLWQNAQWRTPVTEEERHTGVAIAHMNEKLVSFGTPLAPKLQTALDELAAAIQTDQPPSIDGIGYRRGYIAHHPFPGWNVSLPGYFREIEDPEGKAGIFQHDLTVFRISSITAHRKSDAPFKWPSMLEDVETELVGNMQWRKVQPEGDGESFSQFSLLVHESEDRHDLLMLTITTETLKELEVLRDWVSRIKFREPKPGR